MNEALGIIQAASNTLWVLLALVAVHLARRADGRQALLVAATFCTAAGVVLASLVLPDEPPLLALKVLVLGLLAIPWLLHEFVCVHQARVTAFHRALRLLGAATAVWTLALDRFPQPGEAVGPAFSTYTGLFLGLWAAWAAATAVHLLRAARGQPGVVRSRLRLLAAGTIGMALSLLLPSAANEEPLLAVVAALFGAVAGVLFLLGFAPPRLLRLWWREGEERQLVAATRELMLADGEREVVDVLLPAMARLLGAEAGAIRDIDGTVIGSVGAVPPMPWKPDEALRVEVSGRLEVLLWTSPWAPMLAEDERHLVARLAVLADLASDRAVRRASEKAALADAQAARAELEGLVATISHDLRSPLTTIGGMAELLEGPLRSEVSDRAQVFVGRIHSTASFMTGLVADLLALADARTAPGVDELVDLDAVLRDVVADLAIQAPRTQVHVDPLPSVRGDRTRLRRVFQNLLGNAVDHGGREDLDIRVEVLTDGQDGWLQLAVRDNGIGVRPEVAEEVFQAFRRGTEDRSGTGLGLAICRTAVEAMGGAIWFATSRSGADLRLRLPADRVVRALARAG